MMVFVLWPSGYWAFNELLPKTDSTFHVPVPGSPSDFAQQAIASKFQPFNNYTNTSKRSNHYSHPALLVILQSTTQQSLSNDTYATVSSLQLAPFLNQRMKNITRYDKTNSDIYDGPTIQVLSYYSYQRDNLHLLAKPFLSHDEKTTLLQVLIVQNPQQHTDAHFKMSLKNIIQALDEYYTSKPPSLEVGMTGLDYFSRDLRASTQADLKRMHLYVLPVALFLVARTLLNPPLNTVHNLGGRSSSSFSGWCFWCWNGKYARQIMVLMILPICGMLSTVATWSLILNALILPRMQVTQFTPSIMMSLTLAMGMDYTLFLVARFLKEISSLSAHSQSDFASTAQATSARDAMQVMLEQAGQVVVVSGTTLICSFLGMVALPLAMLRSIGMGAALAISSAMLMNLLVIPSLLNIPWMQKALEGDEAVDDDVAMESALLATPLLSDNGNAHDDESPERYPPLSLDDSIWMRIARQVVHPYKSIIVVLVVLQILLIPVAWHARKLDSSDVSFSSLLPRDAPSLQVYNHLIQAGGFSPGKLAPFRILLDGTKSNTTMDTSQAFAFQHDLVSTLIAATRLLPAPSGKSNRSNTADFGGIAVAKTSPIPYSVYQASKECAVTNCSNDALRCLHVVEQELLSKDRLATIIVVELESVSPFEKAGIAWLDEVRNQIDQWMERYPGVDVYVDGVAAIAHDAVVAVYESFPQVIGTAMVVVFGLLGLVFRSIVPPLRSIVSITFTLAVSFGMAVWVYQDGIFASWHLRSLTAVDPELSWLVPVMSFSIMVGLALDYDIFFLTRVAELRFLEGFSHESSLAAGLETTGGIITSAGLIMAVSFGSLLASRSPSLDQWAFVVTFSVLLDTFVVRTILVPAMMVWTGEKYSWYPRAIPTPTVTLAGFDTKRNQE
jgi:uncharacterized membrane protein YdfJ with MMPL/SSD domain